MPQVGVLKRPSFLSKGLSLPTKLDLHRSPPPPSQKCCHVRNHVIFSFMFEILHSRNLGHNVNHKPVAGREPIWQPIVLLCSLKFVDWRTSSLQCKPVLNTINNVGGRLEVSTKQVLPPLQNKSYIWFSNFAKQIGILLETL